MRKLPEGIERISPTTFVFSGFYAWLLEGHIIDGLNINANCSYFKSCILDNPCDDGSMLVLNKNTVEAADALYAELLAHDWVAEVHLTFNDDDIEDDEDAQFTKKMLLDDIKECL